MTIPDWKRTRQNQYATDPNGMLLVSVWAVSQTAAANLREIAKRVKALRFVVIGSNPHKFITRIDAGLMVDAGILQGRYENGSWSDVSATRETVAWLAAHEATNAILFDSPPFREAVEAFRDLLKDVGALRRREPSGRLNTWQSAEEQAQLKAVCDELQSWLNTIETSA